MRAALVVLALSLTLAAPAHAADGVVGFVDTGINPYHKTFRDASPRALQHPSTYLPGFPKDAQALNLTLNAETYKDAVAADCEIWKQVDERKLYWIPGTKIVGAISFVVPAEGDPADITCKADGITNARILDTNGHGTMVASRAASNEYGACRECRIVSIHYPNDGLAPPEPYQAALRWAAANRTWLDAQSNSWGPLVPTFEPTGTNIVASNPPLIRTIEATARVQLAFWASMNGVAGRGGVLGHPTPLSPHLTPSVLSVGGHDSGYVTLWTGFPPHLAADACNAFGAYHDELEKSDGTVSSGTSGATPYVAGGAVQILIEARRILGDARTGTRGDVMASGPAGLVASGPLADGVFTRDEWRAVTLNTASPRPAAQQEDAEPCMTGLYDPVPVKWTDVPPGFPEYLSIGYGAVDRAAVALAGTVLGGRAELPDRAATDAYFARDDELRRTLHDEYTLGEAEESPAAVPVSSEPTAATPPVAPVAAPPATAGSAKPAALPKLRQVALGTLVKLKCSSRSVSVRLRPGIKQARVAIGSGKPRLLRRGTLRLRARNARKAVLRVEATGAGGQRLVAVGRCR